MDVRLARCAVKLDGQLRVWDVMVSKWGFGCLKQGFFGEKNTWVQTLGVYVPMSILIRALIDQIRTRSKRRAIPKVLPQHHPPSLLLSSFSHQVPNPCGTYTCCTDITANKSICFLQNRIDIFGGGLVDIHSHLIAPSAIHNTIHVHMFTYNLLAKKLDCETATPPTGPLGLVS